MAPNRDLNGHQLLIVSHLTPPTDWAKKVKERYSGLDIVYYDRDSWADQSLTPEIKWEDVTIMLTGMLFPTKSLAPKLEAVQLMSAGANFLLNNPLFTDTDIAFCTASGIHGPQIAEWVITTFLMVQHHLPRYLDQQKDGNWKRNWNEDEVQDAVGLRVGILGYGSIGRQIARVAKALGSEVYAYTNRPRPTPESRKDHGFNVPGLGDPEGEFPSKWFSGTDSDSVDAFLTSGLDLLVLAVPLTPSTKNLIDERRLKLLADKQTFVTNIGRGPTLNTNALVKALDEGWVRGAALDVTDPEPLPQDHPMWHKKNVIITPHISGNSTKYNERILQILEANLERISEGKELVNRVSKKLGY